jgi:S-methylmethionine-dependent homocysteine/selenocysteine methylase
MATRDPLRALLDEQGLLLLDGGLATELEARG